MLGSSGVAYTLLVGSYRPFTPPLHPQPCNYSAVALTTSVYGADHSKELETAAAHRNSLAEMMNVAQEPRLDVPF